MSTLAEQVAAFNNITYGQSLASTVSAYADTSYAITTPSTAIKPASVKYSVPAKVNNSGSVVSSLLGYGTEALGLFTGFADSLAKLKSTVKPETQVVTQSATPTPVQGTSAPATDSSNTITIVPASGQGQGFSIDMNVVLVGGAVLLAVALIMGRK
jgi:hypothetical protein